VREEHLPKSESGDSRTRGDKFDSTRRGWHTRGYMPHRDDTGLIQHVTVHLEDSLPKSAIERIELSLENTSGEEHDTLRRQRMHEWIVAGHGSCILQQPQIAEMVERVLHHFDDVRYELHAWVVMPNHIHILFQPINGWSLAKTIASWKKFTVRKIRDFERGQRTANREIRDPGCANLPIGKRTSVWHQEYWDRYIRNKHHYEQTIHYIHQNPVKAGLVKCKEDWDGAVREKAITNLNPSSITIY
jgi:putative transposase